MAEKKKSLAETRLPKRDQMILESAKIITKSSDPVKPLDYLPKILKPMKGTHPKKPEWLKAVCPICGKEYPHLLVHNPGHCERFDCIYALAMEALKKRGESCQ